MAEFEHTPQDTKRNHTEKMKILCYYEEFAKSITKAMGC